ncbi:MAG: GDP-L-fucose synthase family protein [Terriglobales bacterium]
MNKNSLIYVPGHTGLVGSALVRTLRSQGYNNLLVRTSRELDLREQAAVRRFFAEHRPEYVFLAAAKVGGILANRDYPADFIAQNLAIQMNTIEAAYATGVKRLLFLGSSCIYPRCAPQPLKEEYLLTGPLEFTNRPYAVAKIAGIETCWAFNRQYGTSYLAVMPANLYGPGDNYDLATSHVLPALIRKVAEAMTQGEKEVVVWGTGSARREFLYSDDMADACVFLLNLEEAAFASLAHRHDHPPLVNIGTGEDLTIRGLAELICDILGFSGNLVFDSSKPEGTERKLLDVSLLRDLGWKPRVNMRQGIAAAYADFRRRFRFVS